MDNIINVDLKNKITQEFSKLSPNDSKKFENTMNKIDLAQEGGVLRKERDIDEEELGSESGVSDFSEISLDEQEIEEIKQFQESNDIFKEEEVKKLQYQIVENFALPEALVTYRDDEIISELIEYFKEESASASRESKSITFANEDKLESWVNNLMGLVKKTSIVEVDKIDETKQYIRGVQDYPDDFKPIVDNYFKGVGTGVNWITPIAKEKKKIYGAGELEDDYKYSVEEAEEISELYKIIEAKSNVGPEKDRFINYDIQQNKMNILNKTSKITEDIEGEIETRKQNCTIEAEEEYNRGISELDLLSMDDELNEKKRRELLDTLDNKKEFCNTFYEPKVLTKNDEVFYFEDEDNILGKRVLDKGLTRMENIYKTKETEKISEKKTKSKSIGAKKIVGLKEVLVVEPEKVLVDGFVLSPPGFKDKKHLGSYYEKYNKNVPENYQKDIKKFSNVSPFRDLNEEYVVFKYNIPKNDYFGLKKETNKILVDAKQISISNLNVNDKIVLRITYPKFNAFADRDYNEYLVPLPVSSNEINLDSFNAPRNIHILAQVSEVDYDYETNLFRLAVIPMMDGKEFMTEQWFEKSILVKSPNIVHKFPCDLDTLKENETAFIYLTEILKQKHLENKKVKSSSNKYLSTNLENNNYYILKIQVLSKDDDNITFKIIDKESEFKDLELTMTINSFKNIYLSKNSKSIKIVNECNESISSPLENVNVKYISKLNSSDLIDVWGKVINIYDNLKISSERERINEKIREKIYLVQSVSPCSKPVGSYFLVKYSDILYSISKRVFERYLLGDKSLAQWFEGIFINEDINYFVPTIKEFLNKITKILRKKDNIGYNFINILLNLALQYEKHQINTEIKNKLNYWIEWNIIKHVENRALEIQDIRKNYIEIMDSFIDGEALNPNKFKLINEIPYEYRIYTNWNVKLDDIDWTKIKNKEIVEALVSDHKKNKELWKRLDKKKISQIQKDYSKEELISTSTWNKVYNPLEKMRASLIEKTREQKIVESILTIGDPAVKSEILIDFIDNNCYLLQDSKTNEKWYYSKIDSKKTKLLCPHIYDDFSGNSIEKYILKTDDGSTICNNCGQVLNSLTFSYFEGYGEEALSRGNVIEIDGVERVGTMDDTTIQVNLEDLIDKEQVAINIIDNVFNAETNAAEYLIEQQFNTILKNLPKIRVFLGGSEEGLEIKKQAILDVRKYMLESEINSFENWKTKNAKSLEKFVRTSIDRDKAMKEKAELAKGNKKFVYTKDMMIKAAEQTLSSLYKYELELVKYQSCIARISIIMEKQIPIEKQVSHIDSIKDIVRIMSSELKIAKEKEADYIQKTNTLYLVFRERFPNISEIYKIAAQDIKESGVLDEKYGNYTEGNINDSLTLYDGIEWLKYHLKKIHKGEIIVVPETEQVECGLIQDETYTSDDKLETLRLIEEAIEDREEEKFQKSTGVKSRKQFYSESFFTLPEVSGDNLEAFYICKNLYINPSSSQIKEVQSNLSKYRAIDYLITYKAINNNILPRLYENGVDDETGKTREQLIEYYKSLTEFQLSTEYENIKSKSIKLEPEKEILDIDVVDLDLTKFNEVLDKLINSMKIINPSIDIRSFASQLKYVSREYSIRSGTKDILLDIENIKEKEPKKVQEAKINILNSEYEKLNYIFRVLKRDYNYIANNNKDVVNERIEKMKELLGKGEDDTYLNEYEYLVGYGFTSMENEENRSGLNKIIDELTIIEAVDLEEKRNIISVLEKRNKVNTLILYIVLLKILSQVKYPQLFSLDNDELLNQMSVIDFDEDDSTNSQNVFLAKFVYETINNFIIHFLREKDIKSGIKSYKQEVFELHRQASSKKAGKDVSLIGKDLALEFNKVMKGKKTLGIEVVELSSEGPIETAKIPRLDRYSAEAVDQYTTIQENAIEGEREEGDNEEANMDQMD